jgi:hypothetical protein
MKISLGFCGSFLRCILTVINILFFLIGLTIFIAAAILRWSPSTIIGKITSNQAVNSILNVTIINDVSISLLIIAGFIIIISCIGLFGVLCNSKCFLYIYEVIIIILFLAHGIALLVATFTSSTLENQFRTALNKTMEKINDPVSKDQLDEQCKIMRALSEIFECCGATGRSDFLNHTVALDCCMNNTNSSCSDKTVNSIRDNAVSLVFIPNGVILFFELILVLLIPFFISRINKANSTDDEENDSLINEERKRRYRYNYRSS